jgi:hypothetical protein
LIFYDVHGILRVKSQIPLYELEFFRSDKIRKPDIIIEVAKNDTLGPFPSRIVKDRALTYREHFGSLGAEFSIDFSNELRVFVSRLLANSRNVLYVNIVEPLLRFIFATKGYVLLHSACLSMNGDGILLSAQPDTGKTTTVLKILQSTSCLFLSDDMTILDPSGKARCFPKPPTISYHTLEALGRDYGRSYDLPFLILRSRVHSREVRRLMRTLGKTRAPVLTINALGQIVVPPPKPPILLLVDPQRVAQDCQVSTLYFIDRGKALFKEFTLERALGRVEANNDEAFNFPPYSRLVRHLKIGGLSHQELRSRERDLLRRALDGVRFYYLRLEDYSWHKHIASTFEAGGSPPSIRGDAYVEAGS